MSDSCVCKRNVISEHNAAIEGCCFCVRFCVLCVECILPFGMLCLSSWRMMFVKIVFAVCMSGGG